MTHPNPSFFFASGYATAEEPGIHFFQFDKVTGELTALGSFTGINTPSFLIVHPKRNHLYAVSETGAGSHGTLGEVWAFHFEREPFDIQPLNHQTTSGDWPCHLQLDATGDWLLVTNYGTGNAGIYPLQPDGSIGEMTDFVKHQGKGPNASRQEGPMPTRPSSHQIIALPLSPIWELINLLFTSLIHRQANFYLTLPCTLDRARDLGILASIQTASGCMWPMNSIVQLHNMCLMLLRVHCSNGKALLLFHQPSLRTWSRTFILMSKGIGFTFPIVDTIALRCLISTMTAACRSFLFQDVVETGRVILRLRLVENFCWWRIKTAMMYVFCQFLKEQNRLAIRWRVRT